MAEQRILGCRCQGVRIRTCRLFNCCLDSCEVFYCVCARGCFSCSSSVTLSFWCMCPWWWDDLKPESLVRLKSCRLQLIFTTRLPIPVLKFSQSKIEAKQAVRRTFQCFSTSSNSSTHTHTHQPASQSVHSPYFHKCLYHLHSFVFTVESGLFMNAFRNRWRIKTFRDSQEQSSPPSRFSASASSTLASSHHFCLSFSPLPL